MARGNGERPVGVLKQEWDAFLNETDHQELSPELKAVAQHLFFSGAAMMLNRCLETFKLGERDAMLVLRDMATELADYAGAHRASGEVGGT